MNIKFCNITLVLIHKSLEIKMMSIVKDEETRFVEAQRAHPRRCLESLDQVSMHPNTNTQGFEVQQMFSEPQR